MARTRLNQLLDRLVRPQVRLMGRARSAYQVCGYIGLATTILIGVVLVTRAALSYGVMVALILTSVATILLTVFVTKVITGTARLTYHHHELAVLGTASLLLWMIGQPLLPYLDIVMIGTGGFLVWGRLGCLMVGCCHGQPHRWGVCYRPEHGAAGFTSYLVGVRLFPIQAVESFYVLSLVVIGAILVWMGQAAGSALAWYVVMYNMGRFCFEFVRGDPGRPYWLGYSEAQWTALALTTGVAVLAWTGRLPFVPWQIAMPVLLAGVMIVLNRASARAGLGRRQLYHPTHIAEVARLINRTLGLPNPAAVAVAQTSLGIQISAGQVTLSGHTVEHYTLSAANRNLSAHAAALLARLVVGLRAQGPAGDAAHGELVAGGHGAYHLLIPRGPTHSP